MAALHTEQSRICLADICHSTLGAVIHFDAENTGPLTVPHIKRYDIDIGHAAEQVQAGEEGRRMIFKKKQERQAYDKNIQKPMIRSSICTGEKVAGFQDMRTGKFTEIMLIRTPADLDEFRRLYGIGEREISTQY